MRIARKHIVFINPDQFGHSAGYFHYCKHLLSDSTYTISFICYDRNLPKIILSNVTVRYICYPRNRYLRHINWIKSLYLYVRNDNPETVYYMKYFYGCAFIRFLFPKRKIILDIRTGSISSNKYLNTLFNSTLKLESLLFGNITILSKGLLERLKLNPSKCHIIPLGADSFSEVPKSFLSIKLLYVGTLNNRSIDKTIFGLRHFLDRHQVDITYDIIGFGNLVEVQRLKEAIQITNLSSHITFHGRLSYQALTPFFDKCNVGICFVPITEYYQCQPSTKIFEYVLSGMACIATNTRENSLLINSANGVLCNDNPESFSNALYALCGRRTSYNSSLIKNTLQSFYWKDIVNTSLKPLL